MTPSGNAEPQPSKRLSDTRSFHTAHVIEGGGPGIAKRSIVAAKKGTDTPLPAVIHPSVIAQLSFSRKQGGVNR